MAVDYTGITDAITTAVTSVLGVSGSVINFITGEPLLMFGVAVSFGLAFIGVGRSVLGR